MLDLVKKVLASHKCQMDRSREQYTRDLAGMSWTQQCGTGHRCQRLFVWAEKVGVVLKLVFVNQPHQALPWASGKLVQDPG